NAGCILFTLLKQVTHTRSTDTHEHLDEIRTRYREERHIRLTGDGLGKQRLAGPRRADHKYALRDLAAQLLKLLRVFKKLDDLLQLFLGLVYTGDVLERYALLLVIEQLCFRLAKREGLVAAGLH